MFVQKRNNVLLCVEESGTGTYEGTTCTPPCLLHQPTPIHIIRSSHPPLATTPPLPLPTPPPPPSNLYNFYTIVARFVTISTFFQYSAVSLILDIINFSKSSAGARTFVVPP